MTTPYYGTVITEKAHGKTLHEQMRNTCTTGQGWLQDPNNHMATENATECQKSCTNANRQLGH